MAGQGGGLSASNPDNQRWTLDTAGVAGKGQAGAGFGWTVATGDFNGDGYDDVAAGAPLMDIGTAKDAGQVLQLLGSKTGLTATGSKVFDQDTIPVLDTAETGDLFGHALAAGDFNGDLLGWSLAAGNFNGDAYCDIAAGLPGESVPTSGGTVLAAGAVDVLYSGPNGPATTNPPAKAQIWYRGANGVLDVPRSGAQFGMSLAADDLNHDGYADLAIGAPMDDTTHGRTRAGA